MFSFFVLLLTQKYQLLSIKSAVQVHVPDLLMCLLLQQHGNLLYVNYFLGMHAFTGCDSVSAFTGKSKLSALKNS